MKDSFQDYITDSESLQTLCWGLVRQYIKIKHFFVTNLKGKSQGFHSKHLVNILNNKAQTWCLLLLIFLTAFDHWEGKCRWEKNPKIQRYSPFPSLIIIVSIQKITHAICSTLNRVLMGGKKMEIRRLCFKSLLWKTLPYFMPSF